MSNLIKVYKDNCVLKNINFKIEKGKTLAIIGESGSGKSTIAKLILGLEKPTSGEIYFKKIKINYLDKINIKNVRKNIQMIFQNSSDIFDPSYTIEESLIETVKNYYDFSKKEIQDRIKKLFYLIGLNERHLKSYSKNLSGGEKQRANIARALLLKPELLVLDEPVSSLDYFHKKNILKLLKQIKESFNTTFLYITHDLTNIEYLADSIIILKNGEIIEYIEDICDYKNKIKHPYTKMLFNSIPIDNPSKRRQNNV